MNIDVLGTMPGRNSGLLLRSAFAKHIDNVAFLSLVEIVCPTFNNFPAIDPNRS